MLVGGNVKCKNNEEIILVLFFDIVCEYRFENRN